MALNSSSDGGNSSTNSPNTISDNWWNATLTEDPSSNSTLDNNTINNSTLNDLSVDQIHAENFTPNLTSTLLDSASDPSLNASTTANLTDRNVSLMNSSQVTLNPSPFLPNSNGSLESNGSVFTSDTFPIQTQSTKPDSMINPNVMGHARLDANMLQAPGVMIGIGCLGLGLTCIIIGIFLRIRTKRKSGKSTRGVRVMSGFDFNDGAEDDYQHNPWHKAHLGLGSNEKSGFDLDGPITELNSYRHSLATVYSTGDDDEGEPDKNFHPHLRVETGFAQ